MPIDATNIARRTIEKWLARLPALARDAISQTAVSDLVGQLDEIANGWTDPDDEEPLHSVTLGGSPLGGGWQALDAGTDDRQHAVILARRPGEDAEIGVDLDRGEVVTALPEGVDGALVELLVVRIVTALAPRPEQEQVELTIEGDEQ